MDILECMKKLLISTVIAFLLLLLHRSLVTRLVYCEPQTGQPASDLSGFPKA
uniref:Uncharacterized protein n=1 Tax=Arion vulgaris TaxID=1028688 RepID=A0A0B7BHI2_9EUPU